ncbi:hypothetical protein AMD01_05045 [Priestia koreensis]|uniref:Uncharacterized protein n=2 Tax=Priestia koreensis TaxID=284581 RepID=A0A0M0LBY1_9BACI|nr:hypothetical protein AMD01_05045 [Priestia koreensis]
MMILVMAQPTTSLATGADESKKAWEKAGVTTSNIDSKDSGVFKDLTKMTGFIMAIGAFWIIACIIFAGLKLSAAQGGNSQARTAGFIGLGMAFIGGFVVMKAYDIAGYVAGFGG